MSDIMECVPPPATRWQPDPGPAHGDTRKWISALPSAPRDDSWNIPTALISCTHDLICICWPKRIINPAASTIALSDKNGAARAPLWLAETRANCFHLNWWSERDRTTLLTINIRVKTGSSFLCLPCTFNISRFRLSFKLYHFIVLFWRRWWEGIKERERKRERERERERRRGGMREWIYSRLSIVASSWLPAPWNSRGHFRFQRILPFLYSPPYLPLPSLPLLINRQMAPHYPP